jgi:hypothetical protein
VPNRIIRDSILDSERYLSLTHHVERLLFYELILLADDYGLVPLGQAFLARRTTACGGMSGEQCLKVISALADVDLIRVFNSQSGSRFAYMPRFGNSPRSAKPKWPIPPDAIGGNEIKDLQQKRIANAKHMHSARIANAPETETETETETEKTRDSGASPSAKLPPPSFAGDVNLETIPSRAIVALSPDWELPQAWGVDAERLGWPGGAILKEAEKFRQYWVSGKGAGKRRTVKGWRQSWSNWIAKAGAYA